VIEVNFSLHNDDGGPVEEITRTPPHVPAMGEMLAVHDGGRGRSYQVVDVLGRFRCDGTTTVMVRANELNWLAHIGKVEDAWRAAHR
jgi:hypothetical protein